MCLKRERGRDATPPVDSLRSIREVARPSANMGLNKG